MKWAVVLIVPVVWVATILPAEPVIPEGATVKLLLLRQKSVQEELELGDQTTKRIMTFTNKQSEAVRGIGDRSEKDRNKIIEHLRMENEHFLAGALTPKQSKRLDQIAMQFTALTHLTKPEMAKTLNLSDEQVEKFKGLQKEARKALVDIIDAKEREGKTEKLAKLHENTQMKILAVLTDEQKKKVREIAGPPFKGKIEFEEPEDK